MKKVEIHTEAGVMNLVMDEELKSALLSLVNHPGWKRYSLMLQSQSDQLLKGLFHVKPEDYAKRIGEAKGLSLSVSFLSSLIRQIEIKQDKLVVAESKKQSVPTS